jgi:hypothetical protein
VLNDRSTPDTSEVPMNLRRAVVVTATVATLATLGPAALLSASAPAHADQAARSGPSTPGASADTSQDPAGSPAATPADPASPTGSASATDPADPSATPTDPASPTGAPSPPASPTGGPSQGAPGGDEHPGAGHGHGHHHGHGHGHGHHGGDEIILKAKQNGGWTPSQCTDFTPDDALSVDVSGLPQKIVAGSGWHPFTFSVANRTSDDLGDIYVQSFTEYGAGVNEGDSLQLDLARLQFHDPETGTWTDAYQDYYQDGAARHAYSGTFVALVRDLRSGSTVDLQLRVRVASRAPAGASFALSTAVYAGQGTSCNINGDTYDFTVLAAGSHPSGVGTARPNGQKPPGAQDGGTRTQGGAQVVPFGGALADTGTSEAVPIMGLIGALAVVVGALLMFGSRRRALAQAEAQALVDGAEPYADDAEDAEDPAGGAAGPADHPDDEEPEPQGPAGACAPDEGDGAERDGGRDGKDGKDGKGTVPGAGGVGKGGAVRPGPVGGGDSAGTPEAPSDGASGSDGAGA